VDFANFDRDPNFMPTIPERYNKYVVSWHTSDDDTSEPSFVTMDSFRDSLATSVALAWNWCNHFLKLWTLYLRLFGWTCMSTYLVELVSRIIWLNLYVGLFLSCWYLHVRIIIPDYFELVCGIILLLHASMKWTVLVSTKGKLDKPHRQNAILDLRVPL
jgi:hypothetical protein